MNPLNLTGDREEKAVAALIAATLFQGKAPADPAAVDKYMRGDFVLTQGEELALERAKLEFSSSSDGTHDHATGNKILECIPALNRQRPNGGFSKDTEMELDRKRRELKERLRQRKEQPPK